MKIQSRKKAKPGSSEPSLWRWIITTAIAAAGLVGGFVALWSLFAPDKFGTNVSSDTPVYLVTTEANREGVKVSPTANLVAELDREPGRPNSYPRLSIEVTNLGPRAVAANAIEFRFDRLEEKRAATITIILRSGSSTVPDLHAYPVKVIREGAGLVELQVDRAANPSDVASRIRTDLADSITTAVVNETAVTHTEFAKTETVDLRLNSAQKRYRFRVDHDLDSRRSVKIPISIGADRTLTGTAWVVLIFNGQEEATLTRLELEMLSAPLVRITQKS